MLSKKQAVAAPTGRTTGIADTLVRRGPGHEGRTTPDRLLHPPPIRQKESTVIVALPLHPSAHQRNPCHIERKAPWPPPSPSTGNSSKPVRPPSSSSLSPIPITPSPSQA